MPTPSIQTLVTDAQQVLNLDSISAVRSVVAVALANANTGTPLNPNLTTQQLWNEFYQVVTKPKSDIESIIANQLMKFLYAPPAPGGAGANKQVIFNDGGVLAGDPQFLWDKTTNLLTVTGSATITGDLTVDTSTLKVDSANNRVGIGTASPANQLSVRNEGASGIAVIDVRGGSAGAGAVQISGNATTLGTTSFDLLQNSSGAFVNQRDANPLSMFVNGSERYAISSSGVATWSNVGGVAGTAMTLNSTGLGIGASPTQKLHVKGVVNFEQVSGGTNGWQVYTYTDGTYRMNYNGAGADEFIIDTSGNVGIGVTPSAKLHVEGSGPQARFSTASAVDARHEYYRNGIREGLLYWDANLIGLYATQATGELVLASGNTIRVRINSAGDTISNVTATVPTLSTNRQMVFNLTSDTNLRISVRGSDGVTRTTNLTLA